ncbi:MAG TPA: hypothetical protein EYO52_06550 [Candidatus Marinimicrobia bacterium]|jgi:hypothetical protein|nr:hypothetical protein [Candidatus Neomarinimicrobiota bacterium]
MDYFSHSWLPYFYLYGLGGVFFFSGVYLVWKTKSLDMNKPHHRKWMKILFLGYGWFMALHGVLTFLALK